MTTTLIEAHARSVALDERIKELIALRRWTRRYRRMYPSLGVSNLEREYRVELRALVRLARQARKASSAIVDRMDPMSAAEAYAELGYHDAQIAGPR